MIATILTALIAGFVGGVLGAMVLHETLEQKYDRTIEDAEKRHAEAQNHLQNIDAQYKACTVALEQLTYKFVRERGAVWESLNGLWNDYDERQQKKTQAPAQKTSEGTKKAAQATKQKKVKENSND